MEDLAEAVRNILGEDFGWIGVKWGAVTIQASDSAQVDEDDLEGKLAERGFDANVWSDPVSPRARVTKRS